MKTSSLVALLQSTGSITTLLGTPVAPAGQDVPSAAVYQDALPRGYNLPCIVVHRYGGTQDQSMGGPEDKLEDNFQLDIYGDMPDARDAITGLCRTLLTGYTGTLGDGTVILGAYKEQDRDMPFLANASKDAMAFRSLLGLRFVSKV